MPSYSRATHRVSNLDDSCLAFANVDDRMSFATDHWAPRLVARTTPDKPLSGPTTVARDDAGWSRELTLIRTAVPTISELSRDYAFTTPHVDSPPDRYFFGQPQSRNASSHQGLPPVPVRALRERTYSHSYTSEESAGVTLNQVSEHSRRLSQNAPLAVCLPIMPPPSVEYTKRPQTGLAASSACSAACQCSEHNASLEDSLLSSFGNLSVGVEHSRHRVDNGLVTPPQSPRAWIQRDPVHLPSRAVQPVYGANVRLDENRYHQNALYTIDEAYCHAVRAMKARGSWVTSLAPDERQLYRLQTPRSHTHRHETFGLCCSSLISSSSSLSRSLNSLYLGKESVKNQLNTVSSTPSKWISFSEIVEYILTAIKNAIASKEQKTMKNVDSFDAIERMLRKDLHYFDGWYIIIYDFDLAIQHTSFLTRSTDLADGIQILPEERWSRGNPRGVSYIAPYHWLAPGRIGNEAIMKIVSIDSFVRKCKEKRVGQGNRWKTELPRVDWKYTPE